ncbi:hypothetical protein GOP47_0028495 [Adiantum capillus-veneris]|nr:hypothetical protein GOP47_0028495 [Adiantum capillus-veneris]
MAPAAQKKGKKPAAAAVKKDSPAPKKQPQVEQEEVFMKEAEEQKPDDAAATQEASEAAASAPDDAGKDAVAEAASKDEETPSVELDTSKAEDQVAIVEEVKPDQEEAAADDLEGDETGDVDEEVEEVEEVDEEEDAEGVENGSGDRSANKDIAMQNGDDGAAGHPEGEGSDGEGNAAADDVLKSVPDDNFGPSSGKIFIGGLSRETTTEVLTRHFEKYGELTDSVIMKNRSTGQPRGFGFVTYADPSIVDRVLQDTHVIDGRTVDAKRTVPREKMSVPTKGPKTKKIFVGGLTSSTKEDDLKAYFGKFGKITGCQIMQDHKIGKSRGFGFVTFDNEQVVEEILAQGKMHEVDGKQVEIKKAEPKRASDPPPVHDRSGYLGGRRAGFYGGFNAADAPMYGAGGYFNRGAGRPGGLAYGDTYGYGGGYGAPYGGYGEFDEGYGSMNYNHASYGSGSGYGYSYGGGGGYGSSSRSYGSGRYHPYSR